MHVCLPPRYLPEKSEVLRRGIVVGRLETGKPVLPLDWDADITYLNHRISDNTVWGSALVRQTFRCSCTGEITPQPQDTYNKKPIPYRLDATNKNRLFVMSAGCR